MMLLVYYTFLIFKGRLKETYCRFFYIPWQNWFSFSAIMLMSFLDFIINLKVNDITTFIRVFFYTNGMVLESYF